MYVRVPRNSRFSGIFSARCVDETRRGSVRPRPINLSGDTFTYPGAMFGLRWKKFVGSYRFLSAAKRG